MKTTKILSLLTLCVFTMVLSCSKDDIQENQTNALEDKDQVSKTILEKLDNFFLNTNDVKKVDFLLPDGSTVEMYQVEEDIMLTEEQIMDLDIGGGITSRQYRTSNLVTPGTVIDIIGYTGGGGFGLSNKERTALQWAVANYNRLNLSISFNLTFGTNYQSKDMVVYHNPNQSGSGGSAGFPSNGNPYKYVQIFGLDGYSTNVNEHVITHEIGHSVGFRHTDWFSRQSCGQNVNEGSAGVGAIHIPGTPTGYDSTSVMLACFSSGEDGEFNGNDITALNYLY